MDYETYFKICNAITRYSGKDRVASLVADFPTVAAKTLANIESQNYQVKMKKMHHAHFRQSNIDNYYRRYLNLSNSGENNVLLKIADDVDISPALLARSILESHLAETEYEGGAVPKAVVTRYMRNTSLIDDPVLATNVYTCIVGDKHYGPMVDCMKHSVGHEYECLLKRKLDALGLSYIGEEQMRDKGYDKTPDIKLEIPIAVDEYVVNWIESKASFGDEMNHKNYEKEQYWCYWNRFGPGMVIYWFGYIVDLDNSRNKGIILKDHFPDNIVTMIPK